MARQTLPEQLSRVEAGEEIEITRHGKVVAVLVNPKSLRTRRTPEVFSRAEELQGRLSAARLQELPTTAIGPAGADALVESVQAGRQVR